MKKKLVIFVVIVLVLMMFGCGKKDEAPAEDQSVTSESYESTEEEPVETETETESEDSGILSPEFKKTMDDYEAWFDHYCEVMKMYQENPSDLEVMSEMTELLAEESTMLDQMESMDESEMNNAELAYYLEVTARIEKKLLEVADY